MTDSSVMDNFEMTGINSEGDTYETQIVMSYDVDCDCYTVEIFRGGRHRDCESFDDRAGAEHWFAIQVKETKRLYVEEKREYDRGRVNLAVEALRDLVKEQGMDIDPDAAEAISLLAEIIALGKAKDVRDDLQYSLATIYNHDVVG